MTNKESNMNQANAMMGLLAQTSIHAGTGQNTGVIDLPIQREGHSGYPCVFGSGVKGALRSRAEALCDDKESVSFVFGPSTEKASDFAGALMVSDARLLLLPIRSLTSQFKWVTCPDVLSRYLRDAERFGIALDAPEAFVLSTNEALVPEQSASDSLFLEEYRFEATAKPLDGLISQLAELMQRDDAVSVLEKQLVIISNDMFAHLAQHGTPVNAHIAIDSATGVVKPGALWYEETLPPETLLYVGLSAVKARSTANENALPMPAQSVLSTITGLFAEKHWLQLGGNATVGMGWCSVKIVQGVQ